jgi:hypothetical protein
MDLMKNKKMTIYGTLEIINKCIIHDNDKTANLYHYLNHTNITKLRDKNIIIDIIDQTHIQNIVLPYKYKEF